MSHKVLQTFQAHSWRICFLNIMLLCAFPLAGCGGSTPSVPVSQTINFSVSPKTLVAGQQATLTATASSGAPLTFSIDAQSNCTTCATISNSTLTATAAGSIMIDAVQSGITIDGVTYKPAEKTVTVTIAATSTASALSLDSEEFTVPQANGEVLIAVNRTMNTSDAVSVSYATKDGTAQAGTDYTAVSGTLHWASDDSSSKMVTVPIATGATSGSIRSFSFSLSSPTGLAVLGSTQSSTIFIEESTVSPSTDLQYDFSNWSLTLPIDSSGGTGGTGGQEFPVETITSSQLLAGFTDEFFYLDEDNNLIFTTPSNGAVTPTSSHTRSELREQYNGSNAIGDYEWDNTIGGTLHASCRVLANSVNSTQVTIGQIHGANIPIVMLQYRPSFEDVVAKIYSGTFFTSSYTLTSVASPLNFGDTINYTIAYSGDTLTLTINGIHSVFTIDRSWEGKPIYFKLGSYSGAPNTGNSSGDESQVSFSSFSVSH